MVFSIGVSNAASTCKQVQICIHPAVYMVLLGCRVMSLSRIQQSTEKVASTSAIDWNVDSVLR